MLTDALKDENVGIEFRSRTNGPLFKPETSWTTLSKMFDIIHDVLLEDYCFFCSPESAPTLV